MLNENIKKFRKQKGFSQEEMAVRLNVVRQTVSKWEKGLSVPDAEILIEIAALLEVPVTQLLGVEVEKGQVEDLSEELARVNAELAERNQKEQLQKRANEKRVWIWSLSFVTLLALILIQNEIASIIIAGICIILTLIILYRNLGLLTKVTTDDLRLKTLRITTIFNIGVLVLCIVMAVLTATNVLVFSEYEEKMFATFLTACIMIFFGIVSPKLPFTRHTGLRLPWTVVDEETWNLSHRIIGYIALPIALLYLGCAFTMEEFETVTLAAIFLYIGIPGGVSGVFYFKKIHGGFFR